ncbi:hypothetical protein [Paenibacillus elgii]|uniref:hypothetical protein n=1 Tax=Paenibacillus elgii TaxID=189691 RepID=UPI000248C9A9|nr:hypothetical protein [Paenibacillus elgii]
MSKTFHFQLVEGYTGQELTTWVGPEKVVVKAHTRHTLRSAASGNRALSLLSETSRSLFTHYAEIPEKLLPTDHLTRIQSHRPILIPTFIFLRYITFRYIFPSGTAESTMSAKWRGTVFTTTLS